MPLNPTGLIQARQAAAALEGVQIGRILSSPAVRALQTANILIETLSADSEAAFELRTEFRLRELDFGICEGLTHRDLKEAGLYERFIGWLNGSDREPPARAEDLAAAEARARDLFAELLADEAETVLVVTHGHFGRIMLACCVLDSAASRHRRLRFDNGRLADIVVEDGVPRLISFNASPVARSVEPDRSRCERS